MDSHADTCAAGANMILLDGTVTKNAEVSPFLDKYESMSDIPIGTCVTAYDSPEDGSTNIIVFNETLYFRDQLSHSLLCPNQIRKAGNVVEDNSLIDNHNMVLLYMILKMKRSSLSSSI